MLQASWKILRMGIGSKRWGARKRNQSQNQGEKKENKINMYIILGVE